MFKPLSILTPRKPRPTAPALPLAGQLVLLLACALPLLWFAIAIGLQRLHDQSLADGRKETENLGRLFAEETRFALHTADLALLDLRERWSGDAQDFAARVRARQAWLDKHVGFEVGITDSRGMLIFTSAARLAAPIDLSGREHFLAQREAGGDHLFIGKPLVSPVSQRWSIPFSRRLTDVRGRFAGVSVLAAVPEYFTRFSQAADLGPGSSLALLRASGELLLRSPGTPGESDRPGQGRTRLACRYHGKRFFPALFPALTASSATMPGTCCPTTAWWRALPAARMSCLLRISGNGRFTFWPAPAYRYCWP